MATLVVDEVRNAAVTPDDNAATAGGDEYTNNPGTLAWMDNQDGSSTTVTFVAVKTSVVVPGYGSLTIASIAVAVPATSQRVISIPTTGYNDANGRVQITYSSVTSLTMNFWRPLSK